MRPLAIIAPAVITAVAALRSTYPLGRYIAATIAIAAAHTAAMASPSTHNSDVTAKKVRLSTSVT